MKDYMTIPGIGKKREGSVTRDLEGYDAGIVYIEDFENKFLIRQVLPIPGDIELVRQIRRTSAKNNSVWIQTKDGRKKLVDLYSLLSKDFDSSDDEMKELISNTDPENNDDGSLSLLVFYTGTKEFVATVDVKPVSAERYDEAMLLFTFSADQRMKKKYAKKLKRRIKEILIESGMYPQGCKEMIWNNVNYILAPIK